MRLATGFLFLATLFCVLRRRLRCRFQDARLGRASVCVADLGRVKPEFAP